jgi:hypothetical protein
MRSACYGSIHDLRAALEHRPHMARRIAFLWLAAQPQDFARCVSATRCNGLFST